MHLIICAEVGQKEAYIYQRLDGLSYNSFSRNFIRPDSVFKYGLLLSDSNIVTEGKFIFCIPNIRNFRVVGWIPPTL